MNIFVSGGCKNGKSFLAQRLAKAQAQRLGVPLYYVATMRPGDGEDEARIARHQSERAGWGFETLEQPEALCQCLSRADRRGVFLLDSLTAWLANEMFSPQGVDETCVGRLEKELLRFLRETGNAVVVSDYLYSDAQRYDPLTERYRKNLAQLDRAAAREAEAVLEVAAGKPFFHKANEAFLRLWNELEER